MVLLLALVAIPEAAVADKIDRLANTLRRSGSEKARISAAVSLSKTRDRRAVPALAAGLRDRSKTVRAIAATGLGFHGDRRALKALRRARRDSDELVRRKALAAIRKIQAGTKRPRARVRRKRSADRLDNYSVSAKESPLLKARRPTLHLQLKSASDKTRGRTTPINRKRRANHMKSLMMAELSDTKSVTTREAVASELGLRSYAVDLSLLKLDRAVRGSMVEIECEIRLTISNERGKMISFLTGGAKVQVPRSSYHPRYLRQMRREALENAVRKMYLDLLRFLRSHAA